MGALNRLLMASSSRSLSTTTTTTTAAAVCRNSSSPWLMLPSSAVANAYTSDSKTRSLDYSFYRLSDKKTISLKNRGKNVYSISRDNFCFGSSNGWILKSSPLNFLPYLTNPLSPAPPNIYLPPVYNIYEIPPWDVLPHQIIDKFSISGSPESKDWRILIIFQKSRKLGFYKFKSSNVWTELDNSKRVPYIEAIYSSEENLFYTLNLNGEIESWDLQDFKNHKRVKAYNPAFNTISHDKYEKKLRDECLCTKYLVESNGDILLVLRYSCSKNNTIENGEKEPGSKTRRFDVYRLNKEKESLDQMESLGDRVLFLGMNEPFALSASEFPELEPNSIYFTGPVRDEGKYSSSDWGIYNLEDDTVTCHFPCDYRLKIRPPPIWIDRRSTNDGEV